jgi:hypothetical protein
MKKQDFRFLQKVMVFDNGGKTADRYTVIFTDGSYVASSENPSSPYGIYTHGDSGGIVCVKFPQDDYGFQHSILKQDISAINRLNKHLGKYKTINAMKRLPKQVLDCIRHDILIDEVCERVSNAFIQEPRPKLTKTYLSLVVGLSEAEIAIAEAYCPFINLQ